MKNSKKTYIKVALRYLFFSALFSTLMTLTEYMFSESDRPVRLGYECTECISGPVASWNV